MIVQIVFVSYVLPSCSFGLGLSLGLSLSLDTSESEAFRFSFILFSLPSSLMRNENQSITQNLCEHANAEH
jgi:hypothetical protein